VFENYKESARRRWYKDAANGLAWYVWIRGVLWWGVAYVYNHDAGVRPSFATITRLIQLPQAIDWCRVLASRRCRLRLLSLALE
jgi:hypothetical protein